MRNLRTGGAALRRALIAAALTVAALGASAAPTATAIGAAELRLHDETRRDWDDRGPRPLHVMLWYPAADDAPAQRRDDLPFELAPVARGATPRLAPGAHLPLVLLSHGTGGSAVSMGWLAEALAARGYLVAALNHHGNTGAEGSYRLAGFLAWWERPRDVSAAIDRLLADPQWGPRIDAARIGIAGFSLGGYTALASVGARLDPERLANWRDRCRAARPGECPLPPEIADRHGPADVERLLDDDARMRAGWRSADGDLRDTRIRAALAIAPGLGNLLDRGSLRGIVVPLHLIGAAADDQTPVAANAGMVQAQVPGATLDVIRGAVHYSFLARCRPGSPIAGLPFCADPPGVPRAGVHTRVIEQAIEFFDARL